MRVVRILAVSFVAIALIAGAAILIANHNRDAIARGIAAQVLAPYPVTAEEVSVNSIAADRMNLDAVLLLRDGGGSIAIDGLSVPVATRGLAGLTVTVDRVAIQVPEREADGADAIDLVGIMDSVIPLPSIMPGARVDIASLRVNDYPEVTDLVWQASETRQTLSAAMSPYTLSATATVAESGRSDGELTIQNAEIPGAVAATLNFVRTPAGYTVEGPFELALAPVRSVLDGVGLVPADVTRLDAELAGALSAAVSENEGARVAATLASGESVELDYRGTDGRTTVVRVLDTGAATVSFDYPTYDWRATSPVARLRVEHATVPDLELGLHDLVCRPGVRCSMRVDVEPLVFTSGIGVTVGGADLELSIDADGWRADVDEASLDVGGLSGPADLQAALSIRPTAVRVDGLEAISGEFTIPVADVSMSGHRLAVPSVGGSFVREAERLTLTLQLGDSGEAVAADVVVRHDLRTGTTRSTVDAASVDFSIAALSDLVGGWDAEWDLVGGSWSGNADVFRQRDGTIEISSVQRLDSVAGRHRDIAFAGLSADLSIADTIWPPGEPLSVPLAVGLVDVGFPIQDVVAALSIDVGPRRVAVEGLRAETLGGSVAVDPFEVEPGSGTLELVLRPESVQLPLIARLANLSALEVAGSVSGILPVTVGADGVSVDGGRLIGDSPGGTIRYEVSGCTEEVMRARSGLAYARCVLTHYEFDSLTSAVSYGADGNLVIEMRLTGVNPEYDPEQPVNLNPTLTTNVIDLVRSLQAARSIEDVINRRVQ